MDELSHEHKLARLQYNITAISSIFINFAKQNGYSVAEAGDWIGEEFVKSWSGDMNPQQFTVAMNRNWQMYDSRTKVLEVRPNYIKASRDAIMAAERFNELHGKFGVTLEEYQTFFAHAQKAITSHFNMTFEQSVKDSVVTFTVSAKE